MKFFSVSLAHGFPWGDVPDASAKILVVTNNAVEKWPKDCLRTQRDHLVSPKG
ncbi:MAG: hypothetical protein Ct9H300mP14_07810 [Gammaproteobacteria bacterium]|nr:MAG: hypothetical protein Ct9H300mP14_07810 [Gammaproteobacteria bacterium]